MAGLLSKTPDGGLRHWFGSEPFGMFRKEMDDLFSRFGFEPENWPSLEHVPALDLSETEGAVEVTMDVPGLKPDQIDIQVRGNLLTITGNKEEEKEEKGKEFHRVERRRGSFTRSVTLPCDVVGSKASAEYKDGVLTLTLPKTEPVRSEKITIKSGGQ